jgi:hypothetical protein
MHGSFRAITFSDSLRKLRHRRQSVHVKAGKDLLASASDDALQVARHSSDAMSAFVDHFVTVVFVALRDKSNNCVGHDAYDRRHDQHHQELAHSHALPCDRLDHCRGRRYVSEPPGRSSGRRPDPPEGRGGIYGATPVVQGQTGAEASSQKRQGL